MMNEASKKTAYNVGGAIVGLLLAGLSIFGLVQSQTGSSQPQDAKATISYDN